MSTNKKYGGIIVPVVTPLTDQYQLDEGAVKKIFAHLYKHHAHAFILGTTGESASLSWEIKQAYVKKAVRVRQSGMHLYAGISSQCLIESIEFASFCADHGVDAVVATLPSYYALAESEMKNYFTQLAASIRLPLIIYNIPATTHMSIPVSLIDELSHHPNIVAVKDSERSEERMQESIALWKNRKDFGYFLGWAARSAHALTQGSRGLVPSTGNLAPEIYSIMWEAVQAGDQQKALAMQQHSDAYGNVYQSGRTLGQSLWALKVLMREANLCQHYVMPPLQPMPVNEEKKLLDDWKSIQKHTTK